MAEGTVFRVRNTRLGLKLGLKELGWALLQLRRPEPTGVTEHGDPLVLARQALRDQPGSPLLVYLNDEAYQGTRGHQDGLPRELHLLKVNQIAAELAEEGLHVTVMEIL